MPIKITPNRHNYYDNVIILLSGLYNTDCYNSYDNSIIYSGLNDLKLEATDKKFSDITSWYVIKNDDLEKTVQIIMTIIENEKRLENL